MLLKSVDPLGRKISNTLMCIEVLAGGAEAAAWQLEIIVMKQSGRSWDRKE